MSYNSSSPRFKNWLLHLIFAIIVLASVVSVETDDDEVNASKTNKTWGIVLSIIILIVGGGVVSLHLFNVGGIVIGSKSEAAIPLVLSWFWIAMVCVVTGPVGGLAIDNEGAVYAGNLYYFTWGGLFISILICAAVIEEIYSIDIAHEMNNRSTSFMYWIGLLTTSVIVLAVAADIYNLKCDGDDKDEALKAYCKRCAFGVASGTIGAIFALVIVALKMAIGVAPFLLETGLCVILIILSIFEVGYITDDEAPGAPLGNLYYFSWFSFFLSLRVAKACYDDFLTAQDEMEETEVPATAGPRIVTMASGESDNQTEVKNKPPVDPENPVNPEDDI